MRQNFLMMSGVSRADRHEVTDKINDAISATGGWVINHTLFSNIAITIQCALPAERLGEFKDQVVAARVQLDDGSIAGIEAMLAEPSAENGNITASLLRSR